jgi:hypothetical protein
MNVGNLAYLISPTGRRLTRGKILLLLALICLPLLATGCVCLSFGGCDHSETDGVLVQKGEVKCGYESQVTVYYPVAYASPPNLEINDHAKNFSILEQRPDCFRIVQVRPGLPAIEWTARGVRAPATIISTAPTQVPVTSGTTIPAEPMPVLPTNPGR